MRPQKPFPEGTEERLRELLAQSKRPDERARIQAVLMRAVSSSTPAQIAVVTGLAVNSVRVLHSRFLRLGEAALIGLPGRGGRRHGSLPAQQARAFFEGFAAEAAAGNVISLPGLAEAFAEKFGRGVSKSALYRMAAAAGWRRVAPRPYHPKKQPDSEAAFKKKSRKSSAMSGKTRGGSGVRRR